MTRESSKKALEKLHRRLKRHKVLMEKRRSRWRLWWARLWVKVLGRWNGG